MKTGVFTFDGYCAAVRYYVALNSWSGLGKKQAGQVADTIAAHASGSRAVLNYRKTRLKSRAGLGDIEAARGVLTGYAQQAVGS